MSLKVSLSRLAALLVACFMVAGVWATTAQAGVHGLSGNARFQIGDGLPIPITFVAPPNGGVKAITNAKVTTTVGGAITIQPGQLTAPGAPMFLPLFLSNMAVFQIVTSITISFPGAGASAPLGAAMFSASGRTGAGTVTWCPRTNSTGLPIGPGTDATCPGGPGTGGANPVPGLMRYIATGAQFGGPSVGALGGAADLEVNQGFVAGCPAAGSCQFDPLNITPAPTGAIGGSFGHMNNTTPVPLFRHTILTNGLGPAGTINLPGAQQVTQATTNGGSSFGGPWSTGQVKISQPAAFGAGQETFTISGADNRVGGIGSISLVSGSVSNRNFTGPNANRGWLNLTITPFGPTMSWHGMAAFIGLMAVAGGYALRRRL